MVSISNVGTVFLRDCVTFLHPQLGPTTGIVSKYFQKDSTADVNVQLDVLLDVK